MNPQTWRVVDIPTHRMKGCKLVACIAFIRDNQTGEVRRYETNEVLEDGELTPSVFNWEENNFACDCNRGLFFMRAGVELDEEDEEDTDCGDGRYSVNLANAETGDVYYREFDDAIRAEAKGE